MVLEYTLKKKNKRAHSYMEKRHTYAIGIMPIGIIPIGVISMPGGIGCWPCIPWGGIPCAPMFACGFPYAPSIAPIGIFMNINCE